MKNQTERYSYKGMEIIGIDHGFGQIKTRYNTFRSGVETRDTEPSVSGDLLIYDGRYHIIGEQHKTFLQDKAEDEDYYLLTVAALAKEMVSRQLREADVIIAAGLPLQWNGLQKDSFREYLLQKEELAFSYRGKDFKVRIRGALVYPQGFAGVAQDMARFSDINLLADIGNGTMNTMYINHHKPVATKCYTDKLGVEQCVIRMQNEFQAISGSAAPHELLESFLWNGGSDILPEKYAEPMEKIARQYASQIIDRLREYEYNPEIMKLHVMGGGICILKHFWNDRGANVHFIEDIRATAKGYELCALNDLRRGKEYGRKGEAA